MLRPLVSITSGKLCHISRFEMVKDRKVFISPLLIDFDLGHTMNMMGIGKLLYDTSLGNGCFEVYVQPALSSVRYMKYLAVKEFIDKLES